MSQGQNPPQGPPGAPPGWGAPPPAPPGSPPGWGPPPAPPPYGAPPPHGAPPQYAPPPPYGAPPPPIDAAQKVALPATLMLVFASIAIVFNLAGLIMNLAGVSMGTMFADSAGDAASQLFSGAVGTVSSIIGLLFNGFVVYGAMQMRKLENHTLSVVAAALFALPCHCCCIIDTPIGIWALVTLLDQNVKASFKS